MFDVSELLDALRANGGVSMRVVDGAIPTKGYAVAFGKGFSEIVPSANAEDVWNFVNVHSAKFFAERHYLGLWENENETYLDVVEVVDSVNEAVRLGRERDQIAVYDLENGVEIPTGGSGEV
jgi:hypothetical protein